MLSRTNLHQYQKRAVDYIIEKKRCALFLDMGLGKTATSLTAIVDLVDACVISKVLIIAPLRVANSVWAQEADNWEHTKHLRVSVCTGPEKKRISALHKSAEVYVINRENVPWLVKHYGNKWSFDAIVIDESSSFKNSASQRFKALKKVAAQTEYCWLLTGTPTPNGLLDLWPQMYFVDFGERLGRTLTSYRQRFFDQDFFGHSYTLREGSADKIHALIADKAISMKAEDYLEVPKRIDLVRSVALPPKLKAQYDAFEKTLFAELPEGGEVEALSAAVLANKLLQWCNGATYIDDQKNWAELHSAKLDELADIVELNPDEPLLVAYNYKTDLQRLQKRFPSSRVLDKDQQTIDDWNEGKIPMLLAHPASVAYGLNLQRGGSLIVWFGLNWSLELYQQFNGRLHRQGQTKPVRVIHIVADGCIDERVMQVIESKDFNQRALVNALKP